jgi:hypothetical protein
MPREATPRAAICDTLNLRQLRLVEWAAARHNALTRRRYGTRRSF